MLYVVPRCSPAARATSLAFNGRSEPCNVRKTLAAATTAPTGLPGLPRSTSPETSRLRMAPVGSAPRPFAWRGLAIQNVFNLARRFGREIALNAFPAGLRNADLVL